MTRTGKHSARVMQRAQLLRWSDEGKQDKGLVPLLGCAPLTVASVRERWVKEKRLDDLPRLGSQPVLDAKQESLLIALACSDASDTPGLGLELDEDVIAEHPYIQNPFPSL